MKETEAINLNQKKIIVTDDFIFIFCVKYKFLNVLMGKNVNFDNSVYLETWYREYFTQQLMRKKQKFLWWVGERCSFAYIQLLVDIFREEASWRESMTAWTHEWQGETWTGGILQLNQHLVHMMKETYVFHLIVLLDYLNQQSTTAIKMQFTCWLN